MEKNTKIIAAYPACGKSYFTEHAEDFFDEEPFVILDSDSSKFSWIYEDNDDIFYYAKINVSKIIIGFNTIGFKFDITTDSQYAWKCIKQKIIQKHISFY